MTEGTGGIPPPVPSAYSAELAAGRDSAPVSPGADAVAARATT